MLPRISTFNSNLSFSSSPLVSSLVMPRRFAFARGNANNPYGMPTNTTSNTNNGSYGQTDEDKNGWSSLPSWMRGVVIGGIVALAALGGKVTYDKYFANTKPATKALTRKEQKALPPAPAGTVAEIEKKAEEASKGWDDNAFGSPGSGGGGGPYYSPNPAPTPRRGFWRRLGNLWPIRFARTNTRRAYIHTRNGVRGAGRGVVRGGKWLAKGEDFKKRWKDGVGWGIGGGTLGTIGGSIALAGGTAAMGGFLTPVAFCAVPLSAAFGLLWGTRMRKGLGNWWRSADNMP